MNRHGKRKKDHGLTVIIIILLLLLFLLVAGFAGFKIWQNNQKYVEGDRSYAELTELIKGGKTKTDSATPTPGSVPAPNDGEIAAPTPEPTPAVPVVEIPSNEIDFAALESVNKDSAAWLYCPDTVIDYPVMRSDNYSYYLDHLPNGTYNLNGTLFLDYNCADDFTDRLSIIYGHHMKSGKMFGTLVQYKKQAYFEEHPYMYLYTKDGNYRIALKYGCVIGAADWRKRGFMYPENMEALLTYAAAHETFVSNAAYDENDRFVALSTCSYEFDNARYVVIGILQPEYGR